MPESYTATDFSRNRQRKMKGDCTTMPKCIRPAAPIAAFPERGALSNLNSDDNAPKLTDQRNEILSLADRYRAGQVRVFGSVARGDNTETSDVDLLITPKPGCSLFDLGGLLEDL